MPADPETAAAYEVLDAYRAMLREQLAAGDPHAPWRLHILWWARHDISAYGMDVISRLRVQGYAREIEHLAMQARGERLPVRPAQHWVNGQPGEHHGQLPAS